MPSAPSNELLCLRVQFVETPPVRAHAPACAGFQDRDSKDDPLTNGAVGRRTLIGASLAGATGAVVAFSHEPAANAAASTAPLVALVPSGDPTGAADTAAINGALSTTPGQVLLAAGQFTISGAITMNTGQTLAGAGPGATIVQQLSDSINDIPVNGIQATDVDHVTIKGLTLVGTGSGSGNGINIVTKVDTNVAYITIEDCRCMSWGNVGVRLDTPIVSRIDRVVSQQNGGDGFQITDDAGTGTSLVFNACYANANKGNGYELDSVVYSALNGCAADSNPVGYALYGCQGVVLSGCGCEDFTSVGYLFAGYSTGCSLYGARTYNGSGIAIHVVTGTTRQTIGGATETSPKSTTNFIKTDSSTSTVVWGVTKITGDSLSGTVTNLDGSA